MSRNLRQKVPRSRTKATKVAKRRGSDSSSSLNLSDDGGYSAVEDISDSEDDDEENVNAAEERHIITDESRTRHSSNSPRPAVEELDDDADDDDENDDNEDSEADEEDNDGGVADADVDDSASWDGIVTDETESSTSGTQATTPVQRHVRFADVPTSDSESTETDDDHADLFPDIFVNQSTLDPAFRREIEADEDESSTSSAFWDVHAPLYETDLAKQLVGLSEEDTPTATPVASQDLSATPSTPVPYGGDSQELDGYESDGDTTEEDIPDPVIRRKTLRPDKPPGESSDSDSAARLVKFRPGKPRLGSFDLNSSASKPIAVVNPVSRKMMIFTPHRTQHRRNHLDLSPEQFNFHLWRSKGDENASPIFTDSGHVMIGAMISSNAFGDFMSSQPMGPEEAFFPFVYNPIDETSDSALEGGEGEAENHVDIYDFLVSEDDPDGDDDEDWNVGEESPTQRRQSSDVELLGHLNSDTVSAFRRNQLNQQLIASNKATQDSLAFSGPYNLTALRGLKSDRIQTASTPLTPLRRQKKTMHDLSRSPLELASQKRKASAEADRGHKRQRSISEVNLLTI